MYFVNNRSKLYKVLLRLLELTKGYTSAIIVPYILYITKEYSIKKEISTITTDNASTIDTIYNKL